LLLCGSRFHCAGAAAPRRFGLLRTRRHVLTNSPPLIVRGALGFRAACVAYTSFQIPVEGLRRGRDRASPRRRRANAKATAGPHLTLLRRMGHLGPFEMWEGFGRPYGAGVLYLIAFPGLRPPRLATSSAPGYCRTAPPGPGRQAIALWIERYHAWSGGPNFAVSFSWVCWSMGMLR
jgi:hypothetical protein